MASEQQIERACEVMHDAYEAAAVGAGWETQQSSRKPWADVPEANKVTMRAAVSALMEHLGLAGVWDQGYRSGFSNAMRWMSDEPNAPTSPNPYATPTDQAGSRAAEGERA